MCMPIASGEHGMEHHEFVGVLRGEEAHKPVCGVDHGECRTARFLKNAECAFEKHVRVDRRIDRVHCLGDQGPGAAAAKARDQSLAGE